MDAEIALVGTDPTFTDLLKATGARIDLTTALSVAGLTAPMVPSPDLLIIDARQRPFAPAAIATFKQLHPAAAVLMVLPRFEAAQLVEAMRSGVTECLADPVTQADLDAAIGRALGRSARPAGQSFVFVGAKGGIGTTTTAVNIAVAMGQIAPKQVLLIDLDLGLGDAALLLGVEPRFSVLDALENTHRLDSALLKSLVTSVGNIDLLASTDRTIPPSIGAPQIRALLRFAAQTYRFTVIDMSPRDRTVLDALDAVTTIVVLTTQELASIRRSSNLVRMLQQRYGRDRVRVVMTREDKDAEIPRTDVEQAVGGPITHTLPSDYRATIAALNLGQPIVETGQSRLAEAFKSLAGDLAGVEEPSTTRAPSRRLLGRRRTA